jgi:hypothetical protein
MISLNLKNNIRTSFTFYIPPEISYKIRNSLALKPSTALVLSSFNTKNITTIIAWPTYDSIRKHYDKF